MDVSIRRELDTYGEELRKWRNYGPLRKYREREGLAASEIAQILHVTATAVHLWESGTSPSAENAAMLRGMIADYDTETRAWLHKRPTFHGTPPTIGGVSDLADTGHRHELPSESYAPALGGEEDRVVVGADGVLNVPSMHDAAGGRADPDAIEIAENTFLTGGKGDWTITWDDGLVTRELGHCGRKEDAIARFGGDREFRRLTRFNGARQVRQVKQRVTEGSRDSLYPRILEILSKDEAQILAYRRGLEGGTTHTISQTVSRFGVTPSRIDEISAKAHQIFQDLMSKGEAMKPDNPDAHGPAIRRNEFLGDHTPTERAESNMYDDELLAVVRTLMQDDDEVKEKIRQYRVQRQNASYVESVGTTLLEVPELRGLRLDWPQYAAGEATLEKRTSLVEGTNLLASLVEWLARRVWDQPTQADRSEVDLETQQPELPSPYSSAGTNECPSGEVTTPSDQLTEQGQLAADASPGGYGDAAAALLNAQLVERSAYESIWGALYEKYSDETERSRIVFWLERIEAVGASTRKEAEDGLTLRWKIDTLGGDVLEAVDEVVSIKTSIDEGRQFKP
jgi:DNA-binding XRE family transcriptional regulator